MKSKINIKSIVIIALIGIISLFFINRSWAANTGKVIVDTANLRENPEENGKILELLSMNDEVEVIEKTGDWYKIKAKGITGYLRQDLITTNEENNNTTNEMTDEETEIKSQQEPGTEEKENQEESQTAEKEKQGESQTTEVEEQIVIEDTKLKIVPVINATDIVEVKKDEEVKIIEKINGWVCIETKTTKGWIRNEKLQKKEQKIENPEQEQNGEQEPKEEQPEPTKKNVIKTLFIKVATVNLRKESNTSSEIITTLPINTAVEVLSEAEGWSKVKVSGKEGYISSTLLSEEKQDITSRSATNTRKNETNESANIVNQEQEEKATQNPSNGNGASVVEYAKQFIGIKYTYGGSTPSTGFDCSGFTSYVYKNFGINLPRTSGGQASSGTAVSKSELALGDLIIYSGHVAIYVGNGQVIHAPRPGKTVCIVPLSQAAGTYLGARRVL